MDIENKITQILKIVTLNQQDLAALRREFQDLRDKDVATLKGDVATLKSDVADLKERVGKLEERVGNLEERTTSLERSVTIIEHDHGDMLRALFDNMEVNKDEHKKLENLSLSIESEIKATLENHEKRISNLEEAI